MIKNIYFYNYLHNGDIFASKGYIVDLMNNLSDYNIRYYHYNPEKLVDDMIPYGHANEINGIVNEFQRWHIHEDTMFINTWIGSYLERTGCDWNSYQRMFEEIYNYINQNLGTNLTLKNIHEYIPEIDYSKYDVPKEFKIDYENTVVFSNGPVKSGQSAIGSTDDSGLFQMIERLRNEFPEKTFILTHNIGNVGEKILYTDDIIKTSGGDMNEISWLALKSKYIIGRNSGPFCFMHTKQILNDKSKKIVSFGNRIEDHFNYNMQVDSQYWFLSDHNQEELIKNIIDFWRM